MRNSRGVLALVLGVAASLAIHSSVAAQVDADLPLDQLLSTKISTAAKYDQEMSEVAASVTIISSEEIQRYGWTTFDELLGAIRGTYVTNDRNFTTLGVRGVSFATDSNKRLLVLLDGNPIGGTTYGEAPTGNLLSLDLGSIERVEFVRGPGSALYGTGAMLGVLNIITKNAKDLDGLSASFVLGSNDRRQAALQFGKTFLSGVTVAASVNWNETNGADLYYPEFDSAETNNGIAVGRDFEDFGAVMATITYGPLKFWARAQDRTKGIPTGSYDTLFNAAAQTKDRSQIFGVDYTKKAGADKQFDLRTYWVRHTAAGIYPYEDIGIDRSNGTRYGAEGRFQWDLKANQRLVIGSEVMRAPQAEYSYVVGDYAINLQRPYSVASIYVQHEYQPHRMLSLVTGIRHDKYSHAGGSTNPRLAVIVTPTEKTSLKFLYGSAFRVPNIYELGYEDEVYGAKANDALEAEQVRTLEMLVEHRLNDDTFVMFSAYNFNAADLIDTVVDPSDSLVQYQNALSAKGHGAEVEVNMRRKDGLWAFGSYSYQEATEDGRWMANSPRHLIKGGISTNPWARVHGGLEVSHESGRRTLQNTMTSGYTLVHGTASAAVARNTRLILGVRNLFDVEYAHPVGPEFRQATIAQDGRTFTLSLSFVP